MNNLDNEIDTLERPETAQGPPLDGKALGGLREVERLLQATPSDAPRPRLVAVRAIEEVAVFHQREGLDYTHVDTLMQALANGRKLPPVSVLAAGGRFFLVDGHYRLAAHAAYAEKFKRRDHKVPVTYFSGTPAEALLEATTVNAGHGRGLTATERGNAAWRMTLMGGLTRGQVSAATLVSPRRLTDMNTVKRKLIEAGEEPADFVSWLHALNRVERKSGGWLDLTDDQREAKMNEQAADLANRMAKGTGTKPLNNPEIVARALEIYLGRNLYAVMAELSDRNPMETGDGEEEEDFDF